MERFQSVVIIVLSALVSIVIVGCEPSTSDDTIVLRVPIADGYPYTISAVFDTPSAEPGVTLSGLHEGIDYDVAPGTPVVAAAAGKVIEVGPLFGDVSKIRVLLEHSGGYRTNYGHMGSYTVQFDQRVSAGETVGYSGSLPHIHFGLYKGSGDGTAIDPQPYFQ